MPSGKYFRTLTSECISFEIGSEIFLESSNEPSLDYGFIF
jgi:hypothetical protein